MSQSLPDLKHEQLRELRAPLRWQIVYTTISATVSNVTGASHGLARSGTLSLVLIDRSLERSGFGITRGEHGREELKDSDPISEDSTERT